MASSSTSNPEQKQEDRISALPDSILLHILSRLPTLDAVRTSVLSTRWRILWTSVGTLDLDEEYYNDFFLFDTGKRTSRRTKRKSKTSFVEFVVNVLYFHRTPTLHKLRLSYCSRNFPLKDWVIRTAVSRGVQTLDLCLLSETARPLPSLLFASQSLVELRLDLGSALVLPGTLALVALRRLRLCRVTFCDEHLTHSLFSSSTALRSLALEDCNYENLCCLEISSSSLLELTIEDSSLLEGDLDSCQVKIAAPHLSSFVYLASVAQTYIVEPLICVEYAKIEFQDFEEPEGLDKQSMLDRASRLLCSFSSARNLDICPVCVEVLDRYNVVTFRNLNVLRIAVWHLDYLALLVVLSHLLLNPHLRALIIDVGDLSVLPSLARKEDFLEFLEYCSENRDGVMEIVEIRCKKGSNWFSSRAVISYSYTTETVLELVKVLLGSQAHLKKLILSTYLFCNRYSQNSRRDAVMEKVLSFPKLTHELAVVFI